jgi:hypothetical protein
MYRNLKYSTHTLCVRGNESNFLSRADALQLLQCMSRRPCESVTGVKISDAKIARRDSAEEKATFESVCQESV